MKFPFGLRRKSDFAANGKVLEPPDCAWSVKPSGMPLPPRRIFFTGYNMRADERIVNRKLTKNRRAIGRMITAEDDRPLAGDTARRSADGRQFGHLYCRADRTVEIPLHPREGHQRWADAEKLEYANAEDRI